MADWVVTTFAAAIEQTPFRSRVLDESDQASGQLTGVCLTDVLEDGVSMVYSFYDPEMSRTSLGTFLILDHIEIAREAGLPYVYLGYWVPGSQKMGYKAKFSGLEVFVGGKWQEMRDPEDFSEDHHPLYSPPIAEKVANIPLPEVRGRKV